MQIKLIRRKTTIGVVAVALFLVGQTVEQTPAQEPAGSRGNPDEVTALLHTTAWGLTRGQTARLSVVNPNAPSERERRTIFVQVTLVDQEGDRLAGSDEVAIESGEIRSIEFTRDALPLAGEPGSGRLQIRARVRYRFLALVDRTGQGFPPSVELIDNATGITAAVWVTVGFFEVVESRKPGKSG
jgi:hypothetical protein